MADHASKKILIVDDEPEMRIAITEALKREGHQTEAAENGADALLRLEGEVFDLVISDVKMPKMSGQELLREIKEQWPHTQVIMMTAYGTIDNAVESMKQGAFDYLLKPFSIEILAGTVNRAFLSEPEPASAPAPETPTPKPKSGTAGEMITQNKTMLEMVKFVENIAYSKSTVLISGETGTGKEMVARYIHQCSPRADQPFLAVNCAALPEGLLESELFGHEKGAFTGAIAKKEGKFELAHKGTLLLDEVTEMTPPLQAKLLRVLQEHEIDKVGGREPIPIDVRVIATTNREPKQLIDEGKFREDLYYRLNVIPVKLPPLRERMEDLPILADHFLKKHSRENGKNISSIAPETLALLNKYQWRGNVRELENIIERSVLMCPGDTIEPAHLFMEDSVAAEATGNNNALGSFRGTIYQMERELIFKTLEETGNNKTKAAEILGISIRTLRNKLNEYKEKES
ncbi:MAG: sigma-54-dependent Fis family transcriptional regulator [Nitrospina sp.]|nr:MAG: sigma-54-dependent Fis family transcriptional regulator [Nitrospina sp.]